MRFHLCLQARIYTLCCGLTIISMEINKIQDCLNYLKNVYVVSRHYLVSQIIPDSEKMEILVSLRKYFMRYIYQLQSVNLLVFICILNTCYTECSRNFDRCCVAYTLTSKQSVRINESSCLALVILWIDQGMHIFIIINKRRSCKLSVM